MTVIMKAKKALTATDVRKIAKLANLVISDSEEKIFTPQLSATLDYVNQLEKADTEHVEATAHVTGLENVFREDVIEPTLSQSEALSNAPQTYNGYIVVKAIFEETE